jgi:hypothetical protein
MAAFKTALESFALSHRAEIARDPEFRRDFVRIARSIGVDPLASSKSIWASALGVGSFYFELGVRAASVCMATRAANGGLISLAELTKLPLQTLELFSQTIPEGRVLLPLHSLQEASNRRVGSLLYANCRYPSENASTRLARHEDFTDDALAENSGDLPCHGHRVTQNLP